MLFRMIFQILILLIMSRFMIHLPHCIQRFQPVIVFLTIYALSMWVGAAYTVNAQASPNPDIGIVCSPANFPIEVYPGATRTGTTYCTLNNPTAYSEKDLKRKFHKKLWNKLHLQMIFYGREYCQARKKKCICDICKTVS